MNENLKQLKTILMMKRSTKSAARGPLLGHLKQESGIGSRTRPSTGIDSLSNVSPCDRHVPQTQAGADLRVRLSLLEVELAVDTAPRLTVLGRLLTGSL